ncbi:MAG: LacI family DNA-binding transcriptional regulator [Pseudomonadota bacterium]|nr:LacI family DNA-binding transcriptional regulator [Pseudomonadota bacterium]
MNDKPKGSISSLTDLARLAGVSVATASRALAGSSVVAAATRQRVVALAHAHDFTPNQLARNLRLRRTQSIGLVLPLGHERGQHLYDPFLMSMLGHLADILTDHGYDLLLSRVAPTDEGWLERLIVSGRTDGVILIGQSDQLAAIDRAAERHLPLVVWGADVPGRRHVTVGSDYRGGGALAAEHMIKLGRKRLLFVGNPGVPEFADRRDGFVAAAATMGITAEVLSIHMTPDAAYAGVVDHLDTAPFPDAIFVASDVAAVSALRALIERGLSVPDDVALMGYDDVPLAEHMSPGLTTIRQDIARGAALLVDILLRRIAGEAAGSVLLPAELVVRGSTAG